MGALSLSNKCIAVCKVATPLRELTCHMGSHSVTCHPAEVTFLRIGFVGCQSVLCAKSYGIKKNRPTAKESTT